MQSWDFSGIFIKSWKFVVLKKKLDIIALSIVSLIQVPLVNLSLNYFIFNGTLCFKEKLILIQFLNPHLVLGQFNWKTLHLIFKIK